MSLSLIVTRAARVPAILAAALSLTAFAAPDDATNSAKQNASRPQTASTAIRSDDATKYCIKTTPTGTRMSRKTCKTREGWAREGVDIDQELQSK